jgi:hypothetical protein
MSWIKDLFTSRDPRTPDARYQEWQKATDEGYKAGNPPKSAALDAEIDRLAAKYREPCMSFGEEVRLEQGPAAWEALQQRYQREIAQDARERELADAPEASAPDYYRSLPGSEEHRAAYRAMHAEFGGAGFANADPDLSYEIDNAAELDFAAYWGGKRDPESEKASRQREQSPSMERHDYNWCGVDQAGTERFGRTLMRDKTLGAMVRGFHEAGYPSLVVLREPDNTIVGVIGKDGPKHIEIEAGQ